MNFNKIYLFHRILFTLSNVTVLTVTKVYSHVTYVYCHYLSICNMEKNLKLLQIMDLKHLLADVSFHYYMYTYL